MSKTKKHIVFLTPGFPEDEKETNCIPFLQRFVYGFAKLFPEYRFSVITFQYPFVEKTYKWHNVTVYALNGRNKKYLYKLYNWSRVLKTFKEIYNKEEKTVVHSFWLSDCALIGQRIAEKYNIYHLCTMMGQDCYAENKYLKILNLNKFDIVSGSEFTANNLKKVKRDVEVKQIINGIDEWSFNDVKGDREIDVIGVGNLSTLKNYLRFVKIIHLVKKHIPNISAVIVGSKSDQYDDVLSYIKTNNLGDNIEVIPFSSREKVLAYMQKSKVLLHTSKTEGQPYVVLEALASGLHVISTPVGNVPYPKRVDYLDKNQDMANLLIEKLQSNIEHDMYVPFSLSATINTYNDLYFQEK